MFASLPTDEPTITLHYRWRNMEDVLIAVHLQTTPTQFGGQRQKMSWPRCFARTWRRLAEIGSMRHSTITLNMDCCGHLFPRQEADAIAALPSMMTENSEVGRPTGTDDVVIESPRNAAPAQQPGREKVRGPCDAMRRQDPSGQE